VDQKRKKKHPNCVDVEHVLRNRSRRLSVLRPVTRPTCQRRQPRLAYQSTEGAFAPARHRPCQSQGRRCGYGQEPSRLQTLHAQAQAHKPARAALCCPLLPSTVVRLGERGGHLMGQRHEKNEEKKERKTGGMSSVAADVACCPNIYRFRLTCSWPRGRGGRKACL